MKIKIGTQLEEEVYHDAKMTAAREKRPVGEVIQAAVCEYMSKRKHQSGHPSGLRRFLDSPAFKLTDEQFRETMQADYYDQ